MSVIDAKVLTCDYGSALGSFMYVMATAGLLRVASSATRSLHALHQVAQRSGSSQEAGTCQQALGPLRASIQAES